MEQQEQTRREAEPRLEPEEKSPRHHEHAAQAASAAKILLENGPIWDLPPRVLEELAARVGNSGMLALIKHGAAEPAQTAFTLSAEDPAVRPAPVPDLVCPQAAPVGLAGQGAVTGPPFDAAGLRG